LLVQKLKEVKKIEKIIFPQGIADPALPSGQPVAKFGRKDVFDGLLCLAERMDPEGILAADRFSPFGG